VQLTPTHAELLVVYDGVHYKQSVDYFVKKNRLEPRFVPVRVCTRV
jgi:hypothetical protein